VGNGFSAWGKSLNLCHTFHRWCGVDASYSSVSVSGGFGVELPFGNSPGFSSQSGIISAVLKEVCPMLLCLGLEPLVFLFGMAEGGRSSI
jgi:hypothetical protein